MNPTRQTQFVQIAAVICLIAAVLCAIGGNWILVVLMVACAVLLGTTSTRISR